MDEMKIYKTSFWPAALKIFFAAVAACLAALIIAVPPPFYPADANERNAAAAGAYDYDKRWKLYEELTKKYKRAAALEILDEIESNAGREKNYPMQWKALIFKICRESASHSDLIKVFEKRSSNSPAVIRPLLKLIAAELYLCYFDTRGYQIVGREAVPAAPGEFDLNSCGASSLLDRLCSIYADLLGDPGPRDIKLSLYSCMISCGNLFGFGDKTLYDMIVWKAADLFRSNITFFAYSTGRFEVSADSFVFLPAEDFMAYEIGIIKKGEFRLAAAGIIQDLLKFHYGRRNMKNFIESDIRRLDYFNQIAAGRTFRIYEKRLGEIAKKYARSEPGAAGAALLFAALSRYKNGDLTAAYKTAREVIEKYKGTQAAAICPALIDKIKSKEYAARCETSFHSKSRPEIVITHKNIDRVFVKVIRCQRDFSSRHGGLRDLAILREDYLYGETLESFIKTSRAVYDRAVELRPAAGFRLSEKRLRLPRLEPGYYKCFTSYRPEFCTAENIINQLDFTVSDAAVIGWKTKDSLNGVAVDSLSGEPLDNVRVSVHDCAFDSSECLRSEKSRPYHTDAAGYFSVDSKAPEMRYKYSRFEVFDKNGAPHLAGYYFSNYFYDDFYDGAVFVFTDRKVYRPGQRIEFKAVSCGRDREKEIYQANAGDELKVSLFDANGVPVDEKILPANEFGSVSSFFTAPAGRLAGAMKIIARGKKARSEDVYIQVEEYKRPSFRVALEPCQKFYCIGDAIKVRGKARMFNGAPVDSAAVAYRVFLRPDRGRASHSGYYRNSPAGLMEISPREVLSGRVTTGSDGSFEISIDTAPDKSLLREMNIKKAVYAVTADVTAASGETRSSSVDMPAGAVPLFLSMGAPDWLSENETVEVDIRASDISGKPSTGECVLEICRLRGPAAPVRMEYGLRQRSDLEGKAAASRAKGGVKAGISASYDPGHWPAVEKVSSERISIDASGRAKAQLWLKSGAYKAFLYSGTDSAGHCLNYETSCVLIVFNERSPRFDVSVPFHFAARKTSSAPGEVFRAFAACGYGSGRILVNISRDGETLKRYWTPKGDTAHLIEFTPGEEDCGGFTVSAGFVRENTFYERKIKIEVPFVSKKLDIEFDSFRDKIAPGVAEKWRLRFRRASGGLVAGPVELLAAMYDESLDEFIPHLWVSPYDKLFRKEKEGRRTYFTNSLRQSLYWPWDSARALNKNAVNQNISFEGLERDFLYHFPVNFLKRGWIPVTNPAPVPGVDLSLEPDIAAQLDERNRSMAEGFDRNAPAAEIMDSIAAGSSGRGAAERTAGIYAGPIRKNFSETAFFMPHLNARSGEVELEFTPPDSLTGWKFMAFAHDGALACGYAETRCVSLKKLMLAPFLPRFLEEGTTAEIGVSLTNLTTNDISGEISFNIFDASSEVSLDGAFNNFNGSRPFSVPAARSLTVLWTIYAASGPRAVRIAVTAEGAGHRDGEVNLIPVLPSKIEVVESAPLSMKGPCVKTFKLDDLAGAGAADKLSRGHGVSLSVQAASNPSWYCAMALPYLMRYPHGCAEQVFNKYYANLLALHLIKTRPGFGRMIDSWREKGVLRSELEKNGGIKSAAVEETPWTAEAAEESASREDMVRLFDAARLERSVKEGASDLIKMLGPKGLWPWFPGMEENIYISLYIYGAIGRLKMSGVECGLDRRCGDITRALDGWVETEFESGRKRTVDGSPCLTAIIEYYLYARSFFAGEYPYSETLKRVIGSYTALALKDPEISASPARSAALALAVYRNGDKGSARAVMAGVKKKVSAGAKRGMAFDDAAGFNDYFGRIEGAAVVIEAFEEVCTDAGMVEECKLWLINQKRASGFGTTVATAAAVGALLFRGDNSFNKDASYSISAGNIETAEIISGNGPQAADALNCAAGFHESTVDISPGKTAFDTVEVSVFNDGVLWGGIHRKFMCEASELKKFDNEGIKISKKIYMLSKNSAADKSENKLISIGAPAPPAVSPSVGDTVRVRLEVDLKTDMEFIYIRDRFAGAFEPLRAISGYECKNGEGYYLSMKDASANFFIDRLNAGAHIFEYDMRVCRRGRYRSGSARVECMYAPEFGARSASFDFNID